jgi:hypothetical protein
MNASQDSKNTKPASKLPTPAVAVLVSLAALAAAFGAFKVTTTLVAPSSDPCQEAKDEIMAIKEIAPDGATIDSRPDLSIRLTKAGEGIYNNCQYRDGREFEMSVVEPWLGLSDPTATTPAPDGSTPSSVPADGTSPATSEAPATTAPATGS